MSEKLDLLIKECGDYFDLEIAKLEVKYKKFTEDYNSAILNTQVFEIFKDDDDDTKIWPKDVFPDKPEIQTYGDFWKWIFNPEYGSVYYDERLFSDTKYLDKVTGEEIKNRKVSILYRIPRLLRSKIDKLLSESPDPIQSEIYRTLRSNEDDITRYKLILYLKNTITPTSFSKKVIEKILSLVKGEYISTKWNKEVANEHWYSGFQNKISYGMDVGIIDIISRDYPFEQDYYGGYSYTFIDNPWRGKSTLYDALLEAVNETNNIEEINNLEIANTDTNINSNIVSNINPREIVGKFTLKVKSGPGVIIGLTEVDIIEGRADFSGIQFDQSGDYILTINSTSPDVESIDIKIKVLPEPNEIEQDGKEVTEEISGKRPIIAQIDRPTIVLPPMEFDRQGADKGSSDQVATSIGLTPFLNYGGSQINDRDIQSFILEHQGMIPKVSIIFRDTNGMISKEPPRDDTKFEIFLQSRSVNLKSIHLKFKIDDFQRLPSNQYSFNYYFDLNFTKI
jgi:hypothetical protein